MVMATRVIMRNTMRVETIRLAIIGVTWALAACRSRSAGGDIAGSAAIERGRALAIFGGCNDCHTPKLVTAAGVGLDTSRLLSGHPGGERIAPITPGALTANGWAIATTADLTAWTGPWGESFAANLTPDASGLAGWTAGQFIQTMRTGRHLGVGRALLPPMPWQNMSALSDDELRALFAYLQSLKPVSNTVPPPRVTVTTARR
jgi:mono/diheme cytochrome c family protein